MKDDLGMAIFTRSVTTEVEILISGSELADLFWQMSSDEQASFFDRLGSFDQLIFQLQAISDEDLTPNARFSMQRIGEYGEALAKADGKGE